MSGDWWEVAGEILKGRRDLVAGGESLYFEGGVLNADENGGFGSERFRGLELLVELRRREGEIGAVTGGSELLDQRQGIRAFGLVGDQDVDVGGGRGGALCSSGGGFVDQVAEDNVAHAEANGGEIGGAVAEVGQEGVVATAAGEGAIGRSAVEDFEDETGVVSEAADDGEINFDVFLEAASGEVIEEEREVTRAAGGNERAEVGEGEPVGGERGFRLFRGIASEFVGDREDGAGIGDVAFGKEAGPGAAVAEADDEVVCREAEVAEDVDGERDQLSVGGGGGVADEVGVKLNEFSETTFLRAFVAEKGRDTEPLERLFVVALPGSDHAG